MMWHPGRVLAHARPRVLALLGLALALLGLALAGLARAQPAARLVLAPHSGRVGTPVSLHGSGFRPRAKGIVMFGKRHVAAFRATRSGRFSVRFSVPATKSGRVQITVEQLTRRRHGPIRRLRWAAAGFHVLAGHAHAAPVRGGPTGAPGGSPGGTAPGAAIWIPPKALTWYWQLQGTINNSHAVGAYDIDEVDNPATEIAALHAKGIRVICYVDVGTYEPGRPDSGAFPASVKGSPVEGFTSESWLDIRQTSILEPIMAARFQVCRSKSFDAVEPDNMDGWENKSGFPLTAAQSNAYDGWVAATVHADGMAVFQKNDGEQTATLRSHFDGALTEQCNQFGECSNYKPYLAEGKPVLNAEYSLSTSSFCGADTALGIMGARFDLELDGKTFEPCW
jgi:hypothetical protein